MRGKLVPAVRRVNHGAAIVLAEWHAVHQITDSDVYQG